MTYRVGPEMLNSTQSPDDMFVRRTQSWPVTIWSTSPFASAGKVLASSVFLIASAKRSNSQNTPPGSRIPSGGNGTGSIVGLPPADTVAVDAKSARTRALIAAIETGRRFIPRSSIAPAGVASDLLTVDRDREPSNERGEAKPAH